MKILNLKYKMHKLVNLVFYLIIFGIGFLLGFSAEKININKLINQFLFIDTVSAEELICTESENLFNPNDLGYAGVVESSQADYKITGNEIYVYGSSYYRFIHWHETLSPGTYITSIDNAVGGRTRVEVRLLTPSSSGNRVINGNKYSEEFLFSFAPNEPFDLVLEESSFIEFRFYNSVVNSSTSSTYTNVKLIKKECTENEEPTEPEPPVEPDEPEEPIIPEDPEVEIVNSGFYEFAQNIFGEVSEENKFIYDFITFGLVTACFTLFILILGYILKKFFGG